MNSFTFEEKTLEANNNQVNLVQNCADGYYVTTLYIDHLKHCISELTSRNKVKYYKSIEAVKKSNQLSKFKEFNTYLVDLKGTDYANAKLIQL